MPVPVHGEQSTTGVTSIVFLVPLHASMKETPMVASRSDPFALWERECVPPAKPPPNSCSNKFAWESSEALKNGLNPPPNPAKPLPKGFRPNALGSNPGCCDADPYWSYAARFLSSLRIYHWGWARFSRTQAGIGNRPLHVLHTLLVSPEIFPLRFCQDLYQDEICERAVLCVRHAHA